MSQGPARSIGAFRRRCRNIWCDPCQRYISLIVENPQWERNNSLASSICRGLSSQGSSAVSVAVSSSRAKSTSTKLNGAAMKECKMSRGADGVVAPVPLQATPRGLASAKVLSKSSSPSVRQQPDANDLRLSTVPPPESEDFASKRQPHSQTHYIKGGVPCDPAQAPFHLAAQGDDSLYTLVLLRHGESEWNSQNRYTGWCDVNLTKRGEAEARAAGRLLAEYKIELDHTFTSVLRRASFTTNMALNMAGQHWVPVTKSWRLNERHYGALQGYNKENAWKELGIEQERVMEMRRSYDTRPPRMEDDHPYWHGNDRRYVKLSQEQLDRTRGESLKDTMERIMPFFNTIIEPSLRSGNKCLIVSHANTLRTLIKHLDGISDEDIKGMTIPTGVPMLYRLDKNLKPVDPEMELEFRYMVQPKGYMWATSRKHGFSGVYLGDIERLQGIQKKRDVTNRDWQRIILKNLAIYLDEESPVDGNCDGIVEIRQLWWQIHDKMRSKREFGNMLLLERTKDYLEELMNLRRQRYITLDAFDKVLNKIHLDAEGTVVEPFSDLADRDARARREEQWHNDERSWSWSKYETGDG